jgi:hypothetical protein
MTLDKSIIWYVCGQMSNIPRFNYPRFRAATAYLREHGHTVISPEEMDSDLMRALAWESPDGDASKLTSAAGETWGDVLARDVKIISDKVGGIVVLPDWEKSRGARLEVFVGLLTGKKFAKYDILPEMVWSTPRENMQAMIRHNMP